MRSTIFGHFTSPPPISSFLCPDLCTALKNRFEEIKKKIIYIKMNVCSVLTPPSWNSGFVNILPLLLAVDYLKVVRFKCILQ